LPSQSNDKSHVINLLAYLNILYSLAS